MSLRPILDAAFDHYRGGGSFPSALSKDAVSALADVTPQDVISLIDAAGEEAEDLARRFVLEGCMWLLEDRVARLRAKSRRCAELERSRGDLSDSARYWDAREPGWRAEHMLAAVLLAQSGGAGSGATNPVHFWGAILWEACSEAVRESNREAGQGSGGKIRSPIDSSGVPHAATSASLAGLLASPPGIGGVLLRVLREIEMQLDRSVAKLGGGGRGAARRDEAMRIFEGEQPHATKLRYEPPDPRRLDPLVLAVAVRVLKREQAKAEQAMNPENGAATSLPTETDVEDDLLFANPTAAPPRVIAPAPPAPQSTAMASPAAPSTAPLDDSLREIIRGRRAEQRDRDGEQRDVAEQRNGAEQRDVAEQRSRDVVEQRDRDGEQRNGAEQRDRDGEQRNGAEQRSRDVVEQRSRDVVEQRDGAEQRGGDVATAPDADPFRPVTTPEGSKGDAASELQDMLRDVGK